MPQEQPALFDVAGSKHALGQTITCRNDEIRMSNDEGMTKLEWGKAFFSGGREFSGFVIRHCFVIRHSCFVI